jgi:predicted aspartyl protease
MTVGLALLLTAAASAPIADVPFDDDYGLVLFEVSIQGEPLSFLLDTGFDVSILDSGVAERLGLEVLETRNEAQPGGSVEMSSLSPVGLFIGDLEVEDVGFQTAPIAGMGAFIGRDFDGILGHDVLERYVVDIDFPAGRIRFHDAEGWDHTGPGQILPVTIRNGEVFAVAGIVMPWGRTVFGSFKVDTGSIDVAGLNLNFVRSSGLIGEETRELKTGGVAVGGATEGRLFRAEAFIFGKHRIRRPIIGYTVDSGGFENRDDAGTLGAAVLARYRLILDYPRSRIILEDGPRVDEAASHDMSGMLVVSPPPAFDALVVAQITPDSPASAAGLAPGDAITSAGGRSDWTLKEIRHALEQPGSLEMTIRRGDEERRVSLQRRPLLPLN